MRKHFWNRFKTFKPSGYKILISNLQKNSKNHLKIFQDSAFTKSSFYKNSINLNSWSLNLKYLWRLFQVVHSSVNTLLWWRHRRAAHLLLGDFQNAIFRFSLWTTDFDQKISKLKLRFDRNGCPETSRRSRKRTKSDYFFASFASVTSQLRCGLKFTPIWS